MPDLKRIVLGMQYDGLPWKGWQTQPDGDTVQDQLELALRKFTQADIPTTCAGRTDAGVHALEQVVHFDTELQRDTFSWVRGLNANLPKSIASALGLRCLSDRHGGKLSCAFQRQGAHLSLPFVQSPGAFAVVAGEGRLGVSCTGRRENAGGGRFPGRHA